MDKLCNVGNVLVNSMGSFLLADNNVIMHDKENSLHYAGGFCYWIKKVNRWFACATLWLGTRLGNFVLKQFLLLTAGKG